MEIPFSRLHVLFTYTSDPCENRPNPRWSASLRCEKRWSFLITMFARAIHFNVAQGGTRIAVFN